MTYFSSSLGTQVAVGFDSFLVSAAFLLSATGPSMIG